MAGSFDAIAWVALAIGVIVAVVALPDAILRYRRRRQEERTRRSRRRLQRRDERQQPPE